MVLLDLALRSSLGLPCLTHAFQAQGGLGRRSARTTAAASPRAPRPLIFNERQSDGLPSVVTATNMHGGGEWSMDATANTPLPPAVGMAERSQASTVSPTCLAETSFVGGQRIVHVATQQTWQEEDQWGGDCEAATISDIIAEQAGVSVSRAAELVRFGGVYIGEVVNSSGGGGWTKPSKKRQPSGGAAAKISGTQRRKTNSKAAHEPPFVGTSFENTRLRRLDASEALSVPPAGSYLRVHCDPRTFPTARATDWSQRLVAVTDDYVVVNKPTGVPSVPTIDNAVENAQHQAGLAVAAAAASGDGYDQSPVPPPPLRAVSRLDVCTSGLVIFARTKPAAVSLNELIRDRQVRKRYLALLAPGPPVAMGPALHCCRSKAFDGQRRPRVYAEYDEELLEGEKWGGAWQEARSSVLLCAPAPGSGAAAAVAKDRADRESEMADRDLARAAEGNAARLEAELFAGLALRGAGAGAGAEGAASVDHLEDAAAPTSDEVDAVATGMPLPSAAASVSDTAAKPAAEEPVEGEPMGEVEHPPHLCVMELETGRTHQLRLQLAAMGAAIVGDTRYRDVVGKVHRGLPADDRTDVFGKEPEAIALHAARLEFEWRDKRVVHSAERPSWAVDDP